MPLRFTYELPLGEVPGTISVEARLLHTAPMLASVSIALNSSAMYLGQALGAEAGGHLVELEGYLR